jgi:hypothetical protein
MRQMAKNDGGQLSGPIQNVYRKKFREVDLVRAVNLDE